MLCFGEANLIQVFKQWRADAAWTQSCALAGETLLGAEIFTVVAGIPPKYWVKFNSIFTS